MRAPFTFFALLCFAFFAIVGTTMPTLSYFLIRGYEAEMTGALKAQNALQRKVLLQKGHSVAAAVSMHAVEALGVNNISFLHDAIASTVASDRELHAAYIASPEGRILVHSNPRLNQQMLQETDRAMVREARDILHVERTRKAERFLDVVAPLLVEGEYFGSLHLSYSLAPLDAALERNRAEMNAQKERFWTQALLAFGVFMLAALALAVWFSSFVSKPMRQLTETARAIAGGKDVDVPLLGGSYEVGVLAASVRSMAESLREHLARITSQNEQLREANAELGRKTSEIERLNAQLGEKLDKSIAALAQAQKLEAVGRLAGGIAHDFNNLLFVINGYSELLLQQFTPDDPNREKAQTILTAGKTAAELTAKLLAFSERQKFSAQVIDLAEFLPEVVAHAKSLLRSDTQLTLSIACGSAPVFFDSAQLGHIATNILLNAQDAIDGAGLIKIDLSCERLLESTDIGASKLPPAFYAVLRIADNGRGMNESTKSRIFEPFFTTKKVVRGAGLGLATAYSTVVQFGGAIQVDSSPGAGATFSVYLPLVDDVQGGGSS